LRLPFREGRASGRALLPVRARLPLRALVLPAGFAPLLWPLRWFHAAEDLAVRAPEAPLAGRAELPFERDPLLEPVPVRKPLVPLSFAFAEAPFALQRVPAAGRAPLAGRAEAERVSAAGRRTERLLADDWAGLRSRECVDGRLKWGRAATGFPLEAALRGGEVRAGEVRGACASAEITGLTSIGGAVKAGSGASTSSVSSSRSYERRKYAEAGIAELA